MDTQNLINTFLNTYYTTMQMDRQNMCNFYLDDSYMSYERSEHLGLQSIMEKFNSFTFKTIQYHFDEFDAQPSPIEGGFIIMVIGELQMDGSDNFKFAQTFHLLPNQ